MRIPSTYYDLPLRTISQARQEAQVILNDLASKGIINEDLEYQVGMFGTIASWIDESVRAVVVKTQTHKSVTRIRRGGNRRTEPAPLQPSGQANE